MDSVNRFFIIAAGLIITAGLVFFAFRMADVGAEAAEYVMEEFVSFGHEVREREILQYDATMVSGSDVVNFLRKHLQVMESDGISGMTVTVISKDNRITYRSYDDIKNIGNFSHASYVDPSAMFYGSVKKNENGVISEVHFEQR